MSEDEQRIAIAEFLGWTQIREQDYNHGHSGDDVQQYWVGIPPGEEFVTSLPEFDLNEMHEVEKVLTNDQRWNQIKLMVGWEKGTFPLLSKSESIALFNATAAQRREAFLKTLGLWKE